MSESQWLACPQWYYLRTPPGFDPSDRKTRLWAVACCRRTAGWVEHPELSELLGSVEWFADQPYQSERHRRLERRVNSAIRMVQTEGLSQEFYALALAIRAALDFSPCWHSICALNQEAQFGYDDHEAAVGEFLFQFALLCEIVGNPFRPVAFDPSWRTSTAVALARQMYEARDFDLMPILADALEEAGCDAADLLVHCRDPQQVHVRGCWVVDLVLDKA